MTDDFDVKKYRERLLKEIGEVERVVVEMTGMLGGLYKALSALNESGETKAVDPIIQGGASDDKTKQE